jgi:hypothetical protein
MPEMAGEQIDMWCRECLVARMLDPRAGYV